MVTKSTCRANSSISAVHIFILHTFNRSLLRTFHTQCNLWLLLLDLITSMSSSSSLPKQEVGGGGDCQVKDAALDAVVQNGLLVRVHFVDGDGQLFSVLLPSNTSVSEVKQLIETRLRIEAKEQRLALLVPSKKGSGGGDSAGSSSSAIPIFHGPIINEPTSSTTTPEEGVTIALKRVPLDARLEALYRLTGYGDHWERDEITARMLTPRREKQCPAGHDLVPLLPDQQRQAAAAPPGNSDSGVEAAMPFVDYQAFACAKCHWTHKPGSTSIYTVPNTRERVTQEPMVCRSCRYALCKFCWVQDAGRPEFTTDPYELVQELALQVSKRMADTACWFGGRGHMCGLPVVNLGPSEFANQRLRQVDTGRSRRGSASSPHDRGICIHQGVPIVVPGVHLVIRFDDDLHGVMAAAGREQELKELEVDEITDEEVNVGRIIECREALLKASNLKSIVVEEWQHRFPTYQTRCGSQAEPYIRMRCVSFTVERVEFQISVHIDDGDY